MKSNPHNVYNSLAKDYNAILHADAANKHIRNYVKNKTLLYSNTNTVVMDFGGGTGEDLPWLSENCGQVLFCEPSENMLKFAEEKIKTQALKNVSTVAEADFQKWKFGDAFPKRESVDLVLANFAVLNSISDVDLLFERLAMLLKKDGVLIVSLLHGFPENYSGLNAYKKLINKYKFKFVNRSFVLENPGHNTIIHTHKRLIMSSAPYFQCLSHDKVLSSVFTLYIFKRNA